MRTAKLFYFYLALFVLAAIVTLSLFYNYYNTVKIIADGKTVIARVRKCSVGEFLSEKGIAVSTGDIVVPGLENPVPKHGIIGIIRVTEKTETVHEDMPFIVRWNRKDSKNLRAAELQKGTQKTKIKTVRTVYHDGQAAFKETLRETTTVKTAYRLVLFNKDGSQESVYDLSKCRKLRMIATAYYPGDPLAWGDGTVTYLGEKMKRGIVAVDPAVIPLKTRVFVSAYGYGWAGDTGSAIKRKRIDLGVNNRQEEKDYMHVPVTVYLLGKAETW